MPDTDERTFGDLTVRILRDQCIGSGNCAKVDPAVFALDSTRIAVFRDDARADDPERLVEACRVCPVGALVVIDAQGRQVVP